MQIIKRMRARYRGRCACGQTVKPGQIIGYSRDGGHRQVMCPACFVRYTADDAVTAYNGGLYVRHEARILDVSPYS